MGSLSWSVGIVLVALIGLLVSTQRRTLTFLATQPS